MLRAPSSVRGRHFSTGVASGREPAASTAVRVAVVTCALMSVPVELARLTVAWAVVRPGGAVLTCRVARSARAGRKKPAASATGCSCGESSTAARPTTESR